MSARDAFHNSGLCSLLQRRQYMQIADFTEFGRMLFPFHFGDSKIRQRWQSLRMAILEDLQERDSGLGGRYCINGTELGTSCNQVGTYFSFCSKQEVAVKRWGICVRNVPSRYFVSKYTMQ